jgi:hypothetical protein
MSIRAAGICGKIPASTIGRRPTVSLMRPMSHRPATTPAANAAKMTVMVNVAKPCWRW